MQARLLEEHETPLAKELWGYAFERDEPFYSWYFNGVFNPRNCVGLFIGNQLATCLQIPPYTLKLNGNHFDCSYVVGVVTAPEFRNRGIMKSLLKKALEEIRSRDHFVSILMPFDTDFYRPYGWELCYSQLLYEAPLRFIKGLGRREGIFKKVSLEKDLPSLDKIYHRYLRNHHGHVIRSKENWRILIQDLEHYGGYTYLLQDSNHLPEGYVQYLLKGDKLIVRELAYVSQWAKEALLGFLYSHYSQANTIQWPAPMNDNTYLTIRDTIKPAPTNNITLRPFMCGRVVDVPRALEHCKFSSSVNMTFHLKIEDPYGPWNHTTFQVQIKAGVPIATEEPNHPGDLQCSINTFSQLFFGAVSMEEALYMDRAILAKPELLEPLSRIFVKKTNFINEYY